MLAPLWRFLVWGTITFPSACNSMDRSVWAQAESDREAGCPEGQLRVQVQGFVRVRT